MGIPHHGEQCVLRCGAPIAQGDRERLYASVQSVHDRRKGDRCPSSIGYLTARREAALHDRGVEAEVPKNPCCVAVFSQQRQQHKFRSSNRLPEPVSLVGRRNHWLHTRDRNAAPTTPLTLTPGGPKQRVEHVLRNVLNAIVAPLMPIVAWVHPSNSMP